MLDSLTAVIEIGDVGVGRDCHKGGVSLRHKFITCANIHSSHFNREFTAYTYAPLILEMEHAQQKNIK